MSLRIFNTLSGKVEDFRPIVEDEVRMYSCGPTVYDYGHIGNFRTFVAVDLLRRHLRASGLKLHHVMNITDVDDKIIRNAAKLGQGVRQYAEKYETAFFEDMATLGLEQPEKIVRATEEIDDMAEFIAELVEKEFAYRADDGSYYFRIAKFPGYGKLSKKDFSGMETGARVDVDEYEKDSARDFALWKAPKNSEAFWETKIGPGRPGWHIECSVMAMKYLGQTFDLHAGGEDLIFPHHENEIAQSEALTGKPFSHYWMHVRFLLVEGEKMSKSLGNFYTLRDLVLLGHKPSSLRYLLTSVPYRKQLNFTFDGLKQAASSVERLRNFKLRLETAQWPGGSDAAMIALAEKTKQQMGAALDDDLNTAEALGAVFELIREANAAADSGKLHQQDVPALLDLLKHFDTIFDVLCDDDAARIAPIVAWAKHEGRDYDPGLDSIVNAASLSDADVDGKIAKMNTARKSRDFAASDALRNELTESGIIVEITKDGARWRRK